jgi:phospholipase/carboxylesterase
VHDRYADGRLQTRPAEPQALLSPGVHPLGLGTARDGLIYVPDTDGPRPLLLTLHGATMHARGMLRPLLTAADNAEVVLLIPDSRGETWDVLMGGYGPDVAFIDLALEAAFERCAINAEKIGIGGVSDGASYALSLGVTNGDLFSRIVAFSPGFIAPLDVVGQPRVFVSHGTNDRILPIDGCSRPIVAGLRGAGYDVEYVEFDGGHEMPDPIIQAGFTWFTGD